MEYQNHQNHQEYAANTSTPPSVTSGSPPSIRRGSGVAAGVGRLGPGPGPGVNNLGAHPGYDELEATLQYSQFQQQPQHSPYGYAPGPQHHAMHLPGNGTYNPYEPQDYTLNTSTPPSVTSESPPPLRRGNGAPPGVNHLLPQSGYDELDATLQYSQFQQPPPQQQPPHSPYGYAPGPQPPTMPRHVPGNGVYNPYEQHPPEGYLDRRPSYDDHGHYQTGPIHGPPNPPHAVFEEEENGHPGQGHPGMGVGVALPSDGAAGPGEVRWRDPDLHEVIEFLGHDNGVIRANAAAYLQHLCFMDDNKKQKTRALGGIPPLINLLSQDMPEIQKNACGALRNLSYGRKNDENKRAIRNAGGIPALVGLLRKSADNEVKELVTGILWNLSSCEDLKRPIIDDATSILVNHILVPCSGWDENTPDALHANGVLVHPHGGEIYWTPVFRNASGVLRNVSSAGEYARRKLRECEGLVDALLFLVRAAITKNDMDNKSIENCVCVLRNLSYRCQEVVDPEYDKNPPQNSHSNNNSNSNSLSPSSSRAAAIMGSVGSKVGDNLGCFGGSKKKHKDQPSAPTSPSGDLNKATQNLSLKSTANSTMTPTTPRSRSEPARGMELLWQPEIVQPYLALLSECSNPETLEAAAGGIQNLAACYWQPSVDIRAAVRKEKGLPVLVELLRMEVDRVVCAVATALRNLAMDQRNKELIGKYAMRDLVSKLPNGNQQHDAGTSDDTVAAVLATLNEVISKNADFAKSLVEADGMERLLYIIKNKGKFSSRVFKFTSQLLFNMWQHVDLREVYRKAGYKESHFCVRPVISRNSSGSAIQSPSQNSANNTLSRPMSTQSGTKYEDRTLPRGGGRQMNLLINRPEELPLNDMSHAGHHPDGHHQVLSPGHQQQMVIRHHRPPIGGVPIFPPGTGYMGPTSEPVYAQVNRDRKKQTSRSDSSSTQALLADQNSYNVYDPNNEPIYPPSMPAGDSWV